MKILLTGGGTLGSVSPLLAVAPVLQQQGHAIRFVGTYRGPERRIVEQAGIPFRAILAPKLRRYFSFRQLVVLFELVVGIIQTAWLLLRWRPDVIVSAGGYVSVSIVWLGWLFEIPSIIHQQDLQPGIANKLMQHFAEKITVAFQDVLLQFPPEKTEWIGNPVRNLIPTTHIFSHLDPSVPTVLIFGGGTGARNINVLVTAALCDIVNVIHITGKGRQGSVQPIKHSRYYAYEVLGEEMKEALQKADLVVARAGLGTISELALLGKPAIIIPIPDSHQEQNAAVLRKHGAAVVLDQRHVTPQQLIEHIQTMFEHPEERKKYAEAIQHLSQPNATERFAALIVHCATKKA